MRQESSGLTAREPEILVVDDHPANLVAIEAALGDLGHGLVKVESGRDALRLLLERDFALALIDVQMPGMDGFETAELIRRRQKTRHLPIIFVTAYGQDEAETLRGYALGAVDFLFKPIVPEVLRAKVEVFVALRRQAEELQALERRNQERRLAEARQRWEADALRRDNERKDEFIAVLAHELRNPLMPIVTAVELLKGDPDDATRSQAVRAMERQLDTLRRLVDDLLDVARISSGKITLRRKRVDMREVIAQAVDANRSDIEQRNQQIHVVKPKVPLWVHGDRVRLSQVISNLLTNASRYTPEGGNIGVVLKAEPEHARITVSDDGCGIGPGVLPQIFDLFFQATNSGRGLGLGLSLVKRLVDLHGGTITARSPGEGQGTTFEVRVPVRSSLRDTGVTSAISPAEPSGEGASTGGAPLRVHIIDDEDDIRETMALLLRSWGHEVRDLADPTEAIEAVVNESPDVVVIDLGMPQMDGFTVARAVTERCGDETPTLIAITGYGSERDRERTKEAGFSHHLVKPVEPEALKRVLNQLSASTTDG